MLKKLKIRFVLISMGLILVVLLATFAGICIKTSNSLAAGGRRALETALGQDKYAPPKVEVGVPSRDDRPHDFLSFIGIFNVEVDSKTGEYRLFSGNTTIDKTILDKVVSIALRSRDSYGKISSYDLSFMKKQTPSGVRISFRDLKNDKATMRSLIWTLTMVCVCALAAFFLISLILSGLALRPVEKSWQQQRQFVADASHELRNPLAVIRANCDMVAAHGSETVESQSKWIGYIRQETERLEHLASDLLFLARSDAPEDSVVLSPANFSDLAWGCVLSFEPVAFESKKGFTSHISPDVCVNGDKSRLVQLIGILLDNACRHSDEGSVIEINLDTTQEHARLRVRNSGTPIPPEHQEHLFERFYRVDTARAREDGGAGLGLAIAKSIAEMHGGRISLTSSAEDGTVFTVVLPLLRSGC